MTPPSSLIDSLLLHNSANDARDALAARGYTVSRGALETRITQLIREGRRGRVVRNTLFAERIADPTAHASERCDELADAIINAGLANHDRMAEHYAREQGHHAGRAGASIRDNPYASDPALNTAWMRGLGDTPGVAL